MARATLEMFLKLTGANKTSQGLQKVSKSTKDLDDDVKNSAKSNEQFAAGMSGLGSAAIAGAAAIAGGSNLAKGQGTGFLGGQSGFGKMMGGLMGGP